MSPRRTFSRIRESITLHGVAKSELGEHRGSVIASVGTGRITAQAEKRFMAWRADNGLCLDGPYLKDEVMEFLHEYAETHGQSDLDATRLSLGRVLGVRFEHVPSLIETIRCGRGIAWEKVQRITRHQRHWNAISTLIAFNAGLRAAELLALRREDELEPSPHRTWPETMFLGRHDYVKMVTTGKGGLRRPVALARPLAEALEMYRLPAIAKIIDRGVHHESLYGIGGGQAFSQSFSDASWNVSGSSDGAHGLRHGFAQERVATLMSLGFDFMAAVHLVSIELGHFRPILAYYQI